MTRKEMALAAALLRQAADEFGDHGCNDWAWPEDWSVEERLAFVREYHEWNGDPDVFDPTASPRMYDFAVMGFLAGKLHAAAALMPDVHRVVVRSVAHGYVGGSPKMRLVCLEPQCRGDFLVNRGSPEEWAAALERFKTRHPFETVEIDWPEHR